ncbi:MAG: DeoR/GlpR transcriptional regulator [Rhizobiaceae bacterium]|nr:DeoR/GlpR transcriptional regulator [Rhizobiaceae bacterium]
MHESERHRVILSAIQSRPVATISDLVEMTGASQATIRRDVASLHLQSKLRRVRGGAEAVNPPSQSGLIGRPFSVNESINMPMKRAIAREAVALCEDGEPIIINGGTTTFQMVHHLVARQVPVFTNSFPIAEHLLHHSKSTVTLSGGTIYREQNIILSPFEDEVTSHFYARKMFMGAHALGPQGPMEADPLIVQAELKFIEQADELVVLADSTKFRKRSSLILCALEKVHTVITDRNLRDEDRDMLEAAGVQLVIADTKEETNSKSSSVA